MSPYKYKLLLFIRLY